MRPDLSSIPRQALPRGTSPRGDFLKVEYELVMSFDTVIEFKLRYKGTFPRVGQDKSCNLTAIYFRAGRETSPGRIH